MHIRLSRLFASLIIGAALLAACAGASQAQVPTSASAPTSAAAPTPPPQTAAPASTSAPTENNIKAGIQQTLDTYAKAYNDNNPELLKQAADQTNAPFRRYIQTRFDIFQKSFLAGQIPYGYQIAKITPLTLGFVRAQVKHTWDGNVEDWLFHEIDGKWLLSEPTEKQIGKRQKIEGEHFIFYTYPWADDITPTLMKLMENAYSTVKERLGKVPDLKMNVYMKPIFGLPPPEDPGALAYRMGGRNPKDDKMVIFAPGSIIFTPYDPQAGWEPRLQVVLTHEYTHEVNDRSFTPLARMTDWMFEGLADYVADNRRENTVAGAVRSNNIIPIIDTSGQVNKQDLEHLTILEKDIPLAYGFSSSLVAYVNEKYGGMDGYWKLVRSFDKEQNLNKALQDSFGISYEQFDKDWRAWLKQKYG